MRPAMPPIKRDVLSMLAAMGIMLGLCIPLARAAEEFQFVPAIAVLTTGVSYFVIANVMYKLAETDAWRKSSLQCASCPPLPRLRHCVYVLIRYLSRSKLA